MESSTVAVKCELLRYSIYMYSQGILLHICFTLAYTQGKSQFWKFTVNSVSSSMVPCFNSYSIVQPKYMVNKYIRIHYYTYLDIMICHRIFNSLTNALHTVLCEICASAGSSHKCKSGGFYFYPHQLSQLYMLTPLLLKCGTKQYQQLVGNPWLAKCTAILIAKLSRNYFAQSVQFTRRAKNGISTGAQEAAKSFERH